MRALVIYDTTGRIWNIIYSAGDTTVVPQGMPYMFVDIIPGSVLSHIDVSNPDKPKAVFSEMIPDTDIGILKKQVKDLTVELSTAKSELTKQNDINGRLENEVTELQLAIAAMYESKEVV